MVIMPTKIHFLRGDITEMAVDAIVNATNTALTLDAGVGGAIRRKGGVHIEEECESLAPIRLGEAVVTSAGNLRAFYVIHAASQPPGGAATAESLRLATRSSLMRAEEKTFKSIAFPAIGTGAAGFPLESCARIMLKEVIDHLKVRSSLEKVRFVLFDEAALAIFESAYQELTGCPAVGE
jgi:O-acetyl-ADP-ribose deacetylase